MDRIFQEIEVNRYRQEPQEFWQPTKEGIDHFLSIWTNYHLRQLSSNKQELTRERDGL